MNQKPSPVQIDSWQAAEQNAAAWMRHWGFSDARVTTGGADGGIDVKSRKALAQVKFEAHQVGAPAVQRLVGARGRDHAKQLLFFSGAGFAAPAVAYADMMDVALFKYDLTGRMTAHNASAKRIINAATPQPFDVLSKKVEAWAASPSVPREPRPGRGWFGRNWPAVLGTFFPLVVLGNWTVYLINPDAFLMNWEGVPTYLVLGLILWLVWFASSKKRAKWKQDRDGASMAPQPESLLRPATPPQEK